MAEGASEATLMKQPRFGVLPNVQAFIVDWLSVDVVVDDLNESIASDRRATFYEG